MARSTTTASTEPITADWKISEVIQAYPDLLFVLIDSAPEFRKLRNPVLRRVQSRLVTVGQAAGIAGLDPNDLVDRLNTSAGIAVEEPLPRSMDDESERATPEPPWVGAASIAQELDVRPYQRRGEEPFSAIMAAIRDVPRGQVLLLRNTFEPTPLYDILGQRGFEHWARNLAENDWEILFFNSGSTRPEHAPAKTAAPPSPDASWDAPTSTLTIDVSELVPPEPMIRILTALEELPAGASLLVHHVRRPMHLYPRLDELGYRHETREIGPDRIELLIEKPAVSTQSAL
jgi:uncharacterized protein (DUF2249 family)